MINASKVREIAQAVNVELSDEEVAQYLKGFDMPRIPREPEGEPMILLVVVLAAVAVAIFVMAI